MPVMMRTAVEAMRDAMARRGLNQTDVGSLVGVSSSYVCHLLAARRRPSVEVAARIERELGVPAREWAVSS